MFPIKKIILLCLNRVDALKKEYYIINYNVEPNYIVCTVRVDVLYSIYTCCKLTYLKLSTKRTLDLGQHTISKHIYICSRVRV